MKTFLMTVILLLGGVAGAAADSGTSRMSGRASADLSGAVGQSVGKGVAVVGVSAAIPLMSAGAVGEGLFQSSARALSAPARRGPLPVDDETVVAGPVPNKAMQTKEGWR